VSRSFSDTAVSRRPRPNGTRAVSGSPVESALARLTEVSPAPHQVVSCYLKLEPRDRARSKYLIKLKNRARAVEQGLPRLGLPHDIASEITRDIARIQEHLRDPAMLPATQGIAVFACEGIGLFESVPLPVVYRSRLGVDLRPQVRELASVEDEFGRLLTAVVDRTSARFFEVTAFEARELPGFRSSSTRGGRFRGDQDGPGWGEHTYNNRIREEKQRHFEAVARQLFTLDRAHPAHGIILAGTGTEATAVQPFLHTYLAERLMGNVRLNPKDVSAPAVHQATLAVREAFERATERHVVDEAVERLGEGWAVNGVSQTLKALARGQVRSLLVNADASMPGVRFADTGSLGLDARDGRGQGTPLPVLDVIDDAIEEALRQHVDLNVVYDPEAAGKIDGLAALLRFR
jgi:peptide subunit release factor 1 (eRF1)